MNRLWRILGIALVVVAFVPEVLRYQAEWQLAEANARLSRVLLGKQSAQAAHDSAEAAVELAGKAESALPDDPRAWLMHGVALMLANRGSEGLAVLQNAVLQGERPELTLNLGRARFSQGDEAGANAAYLRTAWANPYAIDTLPKPMQEALRDQVAALEQELRAGRLKAPPPLSP
jgi:predicted Zn-dependent protease